MKKDFLVIVRGGGDLATGCIHRLWSAGFKVLVLECAAPAAIRRQVSVCEAVYEGSNVFEGMTAILINNVQDAEAVWQAGNVPVLVDEVGTSIKELHPDVVVDAIIAKKNLGTKIDMAPMTIATIISATPPQVVTLSILRLPFRCDMSVDLKHSDIMCCSSE
jgi:xanthine dehydrogenase accessory factor